MSKRIEYQKRDMSSMEKHIAAWEQSGISQVEYCRENKIPLSTFGNWKSKVSKKSQKEIPFIELQGNFSYQDEYFELLLDDGMTLRIRETIPVSQLRNIILAIRR